MRKEKDTSDSRSTSVTSYLEAGADYVITSMAELTEIMEKLRENETFNSISPTIPLSQEMDLERVF